VKNSLKRFAILCIAFYFVLNLSQMQLRRNGQVVLNILNNYHNITSISLEYNSTVFWFYGENLEPAREYLNPLRGGFTDTHVYDISLPSGVEFARVRYYIEDMLLFSATISEVPHGIREAFLVIGTNNSTALVALFIDGTSLMGVTNNVVLSVRDLISF